MRPTISLIGLAWVLASPASAQGPLSPRDSALHVLNRLAWGPAPGQVDAVIREGALAWADRQLAVRQTDDPRLAASLSGRFTVLGTTQADMIGLFVAQQQQQLAQRTQPGNPGTPPPEAPPDPRAQRPARNDLRELGAQTQQLVLVRAVASERRHPRLMGAPSRPWPSRR